MGGLVFILGGIMRNWFFIFISIVMGFVSIDVWAATILVPQDQLTIQDGIDAANNGDVVLVNDGIFKGYGNKNLDFGGKQLTVKSVNGPEKTTIDCEQEGRGFYFHNEEGANSVVDGFTIINGYSDRGGAIHTSYSSPTIRNCIIYYNTADMSDSVKQKRLIHCPCFIGGFHFICRALAEVRSCNDG